MKTFIKKHPIWSFLIINYLISWSFLYPSYQIILKNDGITPLALLGLIGAYGPSIAAILVQRIEDKKKLKTLLKKLLQVKTKWKTVLFVLVIPILLYVGSYLITRILLNEGVNFSLMIGLSNIPLWFLLALPFGPLGEELGWRGYLLPKLLESNSIIKSTVLVGLAWGIWHLAAFTFPGAAIPSFMEVNLWTISLYCINTIALSFVYTYVYLVSKASVFWAILLHAFFNAAPNIAFDFLPETDSYSIQLIAYCLNIALAALVGYLMVRMEVKGEGRRVMGER